MTTLPTGTTTFLFTDIEGSTILWETYPRTMRSALLRHDGILRDTISLYNGVVFKTMGDAYCAVFPTAPDAIAAVVEAQRFLQSEPWPETGPLRVRMALNTGSADERDGDYYGPPLNRVARLLSAAHGAQVLLFGVTVELAKGMLPAGTGFKALGTHKLKDLQCAAIFQLTHTDLRVDFPEIKSLNNQNNNLPAQLTTFIGREKEIAELKLLVKSSRLLTLTGAGGCGKTRLALQVAAELAEEDGEGVWLAELASLSDPELVPQTIVTALGLREESGKALIQTLIDFIQSKRILLVLDNCEHLLSACAILSEALLRSCPNVYLLAASREGLGIAGETTYRIPSLSLPDIRKAPTLENLLQSESARLFVERARAAQPNFVLTEANAPALMHLCRRLDGIPFAIELAAARVKSLSVAQIAQRLDDRFHLLTGGNRTALPRQQTLRALIDWSYDLLSPQEQALLRRLSVFAGGWTLEAAEKVCSDRAA